MSRFVQPREPNAGPVAPRRSVYEDRPRPARPGVRVAETNPFTGELEWGHDWDRRVLGWMPLEEFLRER